MTVAVRTLWLLAFCLLFCLPVVAQSNRGPSTPEERATAVKSARLLETDPFNKDAKKAREWFLKWLIEVPDISVEICTDYLSPLFGKKNKNNEAELVIQMTFSIAVFIIENPDKAKDGVAVNLAGLEGTLKMYESILKSKPDAKIDFLDQLIAKRDKGELRAYVEDIAANKCKGGKK
jgi:carboxypeptidase Q